MSTRFELPLTAGHAGEFLAVNPTETGYLWDPGTGPVGFFVQENAVSLPQRPRLNFINFFSLADNPGNTSTDVDLDVVAIANDATFVTALVANNFFTTSLANNNNFYTTLVANNAFTTLLANDVNFITNLTANPTFITNITTSGGLQAGILFEDEGVPLGTVATVDNVDFVGAGVTATRIGNTVTVTIPGAGSALVIQDGGVPLANEPALNFVNYFTLTNNPGVANDVDINVTQLAGDAVFVTAIANNATFVTTLVANATFTTALGGDVNFINTLTSDPLFITNVITNSGVQTGIQYQDEGVNLGTSGTVDTLDFTGAGITATRLGNTVTVAVGGGTPVVAEQNLGGVTLTSPFNPGILGTSSSQDGADLYFMSADNGTNNTTIFRYTLDVNSGLYYYAADNASSSGDSAQGVNGIVELGGFVYAFDYNSGGSTRVCNRFAATNLGGGATVMTFVGGTVNMQIEGAFTDGTDLFVHISSTGNVEQYSISGTTLTFVQTVTGINASTLYTIYDQTLNRLYALDSGGTVRVYTIAGALFTLVATQIYDMLQLSPEQSTTVGISLSSDSNLIYISYGLQEIDGGGDSLCSLMIKAFTKPT